MIRIQHSSGSRDRRPGATDADVYVLCDGAVGDAVARRFRRDGRAVTRIESSPEQIDVPAGSGGHTDLPALLDADLEGASTVIVATPSDGRNLLAAQLLRSRFDVERVLVVANEPERVDAFADAGHEPVCVSTVLADAIADLA